MTKIEAGRLSLTVSGHCGYGPAGSDIVCASVSALCYTLAYNLSLEEGKSVLKLDAVFEPGKVSISCVPRKGREREVRRIFSVVENGLKMLEENYPDHVSGV